jgi:hypothetical protein
MLGALALLFAHSPLSADSTSQDASMLLQNSVEPFVTRPFAQRLALLVVSQKYRGAVISKDPPQVHDKGDTWQVTVRLDRTNLPKSLTDSGLMAPELTVTIRKNDAAILSIK